MEWRGGRRWDGRLRGGFKNPRSNRVHLEQNVEVCNNHINFTVACLTWDSLAEHPETAVIGCPSRGLRTPGPRPEVKNSATRRQRQRYHDVRTRAQREFESVVMVWVFLAARLTLLLFCETPNCSAVFRSSTSTEAAVMTVTTSVCLMLLRDRAV